MTTLTKGTLLFFLCSLILISCNHYDSITASGRESTPGGRSHNEGRDCMSCHHDGTSSASNSGTWWYIAGTAYNSNGSVASSGKVEFWSSIDSAASLIYSLPVDKNGNFYTSKIINFKTGLYPKVISSNGDTSMTQAVVFNNASCNSCHGNNADFRNQPKVKFK